MANYSAIKSEIDLNIKSNGNEEITGPILNGVLKDMITALGNGYLYKGIATPATSPGTPDTNVFYIATTPGTYTNLGGIVLADGEVAILKYDTSWSKEVTGAATAAQVTQLAQDVTELSVLSDTAAGSLLNLPIKPFTSENTRVYPRLPLIAGHKYHFKIIPNGYEVYPTQTYSFFLRTVTDETGSNIVETVKSMSRTDYTGAVVEFDFTPTQSAPYLYIYIARARVRGTGCVFVVTEETTQFAGLQNAIAERSESFTLLPSSNAAAVIFPKFKMFAGRSYRITIKQNGYIAGGGTYSNVVRAMKTPAISGIDDPNIVAVIMMLSATYYASGDVIIKYVAQQDSEYVQLYAGMGSTIGTGIVATIEELSLTVKTDKSLSIPSLAADAVAVGNAFGRNGDYIYSGEPLDLHTRRTTILPLIKLQTAGSQGCDVAEGKLFQAFDGGTCRVYNFDPVNKIELGHFTFGCASPDNHCNSINFGVETPTGCDFPALYVSTGKADSPIDFVCNVEGVTVSGGTYSSQTVQQITLDISGWQSAGYVPIWGAPHWLVDKERGFLWVFSAKLRTTVEYTGDFKNNKYIATQFRLPLLSEGNVTFDADDIIRQVVFVFDTYFTQGGTMKDGKIYYCFGVGTTQYPANMRVFDTDNGSVATRMTAMLSQEPEDMMVYANDLYMITATADIYKLT